MFTRSSFPIPRVLNFLLHCLGWSLLLTTAQATENATASPKPKEKPDWVFSILPKSLQKNPNLDLTVITEMTEAGKQRPVVSAANPAYYIFQSLGYRAMGEMVGHENKIPQAEIEHMLEKSLESAGYRAAKPPEHPPTLAIFYVWGSHNLFDPSAADDSALGSELVVRNILDRAQMVGGEKFAQKLHELFDEASVQAQANRFHGIDPGLINAFQDPVTRFKQLDPKNEFLVDQAAMNCFYAVATAYDYEAMTKGRRVLLWRTRMTANSAGVSQEQSLPTLLTAASPFFGREMEGPEILVRKSVREGKVDVGAPVVVPPTTTAPTEKK